MMEKLRGIHEVLSEEEISGFLSETYPDMNQPIEFEPFLKVHGIIFFFLPLHLCWGKKFLFLVTQPRKICQEYLNIQAKGSSKSGGKKKLKGSVSFLKASTTTLLHVINESEKTSYVNHINNFLKEDPFLKNFLPLDPASNELFNLVRDGVLLW